MSITYIPPKVLEYFTEAKSGLSKPDLNEILDNSGCLATIAISVFNEASTQNVLESNIGNTIAQIYSQCGSDGRAISRDKYEIVIVDNNSTDQTRHVIQTLPGTFPNLKVVALSEEKQGIKYAKKRAMDEALQRQLIRLFHGETKKLPAIVSVDGDMKEFSPDWLRNILQQVENSLDGGFSGIYYFDEKTDAMLPNATQILYEQYHIYPALWRLFGRMTPGSNSGFDPFTYANIGGYTQPFSHGGDLHLGTKAVNFGKQISDLDAAVRVDGRRLKLNPANFVAGKGYEKLEHDYSRTSYQDKDIKSDDMPMFRRLRLLSTINSQFFLQCALKPNILFNPTKESEFSYYLGGQDHFHELQRTFLELSLRSSPQKTAEFLANKFGEPVFDKLKGMHQEYRNLDYHVEL